MWVQTLNAAFWSHLTCLGFLVTSVRLCQGRSPPPSPSSSLSTLSVWFLLMTPLNPTWPPFTPPCPPYLLYRNLKAHATSMAYPLAQKTSLLPISHRACGSGIQIGLRGLPCLDGHHYSVKFFPTSNPITQTYSTPHKHTCRLIFFFCFFFSFVYLADRNHK